MTARALTIAARVFAGIAVAVSPISARLPGYPLTVCDIALALAALCLTIRYFIQDDRTAIPPRALGGPLMVLGACGLSAACATDLFATAKDGVQLVLYMLVGTTVFRSLNGKRWRSFLCRCLWLAVAVATVSCAGAFVCPESIAPLLPPWPTLLSSFALLIGLTIALLPASARRTCIAAALLTALALTAAAEAFPAVRVTGEPVPQQLREAYAALSVVAEHPLLGVGLGNYQAHIGEYYQGMPKDNSMTAGTGLGYSILVASVGLIGLAAYLEWLRRLWRAAAGMRLRIAVATLVAAGFVTPVFVGPVLLPMAVVAGLASPRARSRRICTVAPRGLATLVARLAGVVVMLVLSVRTTPENAFTFAWEAEGFAEIQAPMRVRDGVAEASARHAIELPLGCGQGWRGQGTGSVTYRVDMPHAGQYRLWGRALWKDGCTNAVFLTANDGHRVVFGNDAVFKAWHWVRGQQLTLVKGLNYLVLANHSDGIALDKFILTDDLLYVPEGLGEDISQFFDGFVGCDADNTGSWDFLSGRWRVLRGVGEGASGANDCLAQWDPEGGTALGGFPTWHDYDATVKVMLPGPGTIGLAVFRQGGGSELQLLCETAEEGARFRLVEETSGHSRELAQMSAPGNFADRWLELGFRLEAGEVEGLVDGRSLLRASYRGSRHGQIALFSKGSAGSYFDNVHVVFRR